MYTPSVTHYEGANVPIVETVTFNLNKEGYTPIPKLANNDGTITPLSAADFGLVDYRIIGWYLDEALTIPVQSDTVFSDNLTVYAKLVEIKKFTVNFDTQGRDLMASYIDVEEGTIIKEPTAPLKTGYVFKGWTLDLNTKALFDFATPISEDTTLYALWEAVVTPEDPTDKPKIPADTGIENNTAWLYVLIVSSSLLFVLRKRWHTN